MFVKKITKRDKVTKKQYVTYRLVHSYRLAGQPRHMNIMNLGTLPGIDEEDHKALANRIECLLREGTELFPAENSQVEQAAQMFYKKVLQKYHGKNQAATAIFGRPGNKTSKESTQDQKQYHNVDLDTFSTDESRSIGPEWLCIQAIEEIGLSKLLQEKFGSGQKKYRYAMHALLGRLVYPGSENRTAYYINENSAAGLLLQTEGSAVSRKQLSRACDMIHTCKDDIEEFLVGRFRDLFNYRPCLLIYDLTNTHFTGRMESSEKALHGRNKQKRNDCPQITIALAIDEHGFAQHSRFYEGNIGETATMEEIIDGLTANIKGYENSFSNKRPIIVMDAGIASEDNIKLAHSKGFDYLAVSRSQHNNIKALAKGQELTEMENANGEKVYVKSYPSQISYKNANNQDIKIDETLLYVETQQKKQKESAIIQGKRKKFEENLERLQKTIRNGKKKKNVVQLHEQIGRIKERYSKAQSCYKITVSYDKARTYATDITWEYIEKNKKEQETGTYIIRTSIDQKRDTEIWRIYHKITEVESMFRMLKNDLKMRPVFHQEDIHIESHLFLCVIALQVVLFIRHKLKNKQICHSWPEIMRILQTQVYNTNTVKKDNGNNVIIHSCTRPGAKAKEIYQALEYKPVPFYRKYTIIENN